MDAPSTTTPPPMAAPTPPAAPQHISKRAARKRERQEEEADDFAWLMGAGPEGRDGGMAKLTCSPPSDNEVARITEPTQPAPIKPTAIAKPAAVDPLSKYKPIAVRRCESDDFFMDRQIPATEPQGKPA
jgi:hypothetical protein